jgi:hypothetical protein
LNANTDLNELAAAVDAAVACSSECKSTRPLLDVVAAASTAPPAPPRLLEDGPTERPQLFNVEDISADALPAHVNAQRVGSPVDTGAHGHVIGGGVAAASSLFVSAHHKNSPKFEGSVRSFIWHSCLRVAVCSNTFACAAALRNIVKCVRATK